MGECASQCFTVTGECAISGCRHQWGGDPQFEGGLSTADRRTVLGQCAIRGDSHASLCHQWIHVNSGEETVMAGWAIMCGMGRVMDSALSVETVMGECAISGYTVISGPETVMAGWAINGMSSLFCGFLR